MIERQPKTPVSPEVRNQGLFGRGDIFVSMYEHKLWSLASAPDEHGISTVSVHVFGTEAVTAPQPADARYAEINLDKPYLSPLAFELGYDVNKQELRSIKGYDLKPDGKRPRAMIYNDPDVGVHIFEIKSNGDFQPVEDSERSDVMDEILKFFDDVSQKVEAGDFIYHLPQSN